MPRHVRTGDLVMVTSGSNKGKTGTIMRVLAGEEPGQERVVIKGLNLRTKHLKPTRTAPQGGIVTREAPIHISNVSPVVDGKPTRVRFVTKADGAKVRVAARNGAELGVVRSADAKKGVSKPDAGTTAKATAAAKPAGSTKSATGATKSAKAPAKASAKKA
jgi:large subunit ribosomal protein L24